MKKKYILILILLIVVVISSGLLYYKNINKVTNENPNIILTKKPVVPNNPGNKVDKNQAPIILDKYIKELNKQEINDSKNIISKLTFSELLNKLDTISKNISSYHVDFVSYRGDTQSKMIGDYLISNGKVSFKQNLISIDNKKSNIIDLNGFEYVQLDSVDWRKLKKDTISSLYTDYINYLQSLKDYKEKLNVTIYEENKQYILEIEKSNSNTFIKTYFKIDKQTERITNITEYSTAGKRETKFSKFNKSFEISPPSNIKN